MKSVLPPRPRPREGARLELRPIIAYHGEPPEGHRQAAAYNSFYSFWLIEKGGVLVSCHAGSVHLQAGQWILVPPFLHKRQDFQPGSLLYSLGFEASWTGQLPWMKFESPLSGPVSSENKLLTFTRSAVRAVTGGKNGYQQLNQLEFDGAAHARFLGFLYLLLAELTPLLEKQGARILSAHANDPRIDRLAREIQSKPNLQNLPYGRWRQEVGLSRVQIDRLFREEFGSSPRAQRDRYLLAAIKRHLLTRSNSTKETAAGFGFSDSSHLCRWFRQHAGCSPEEFRRHGAG